MRSNYPYGATPVITARGMRGRDHFSRHYKSVVLCEWKAGEVRYIIVCTMTCTASTASAGLHGGLLKPLARGCQYTREHYYAVGTIFFPTAFTFCNGHTTDLNLFSQDEDLP